MFILKKDDLVKDAGPRATSAMGWVCLLFTAILIGIDIPIIVQVALGEKLHPGLFIMGAITLGFLLMTIRLMRRNPKRPGVMSPLALRIIGVLFAFGGAYALFTAIYRKEWQRMGEALKFAVGGTIVALATFSLAKKREQLAAAGGDNHHPPPENDQSSRRFVLVHLVGTAPSTVSERLSEFAEPAGDGRRFLRRSDSCTLEITCCDLDNLKLPSKDLRSLNAKLGQPPDVIVCAFILGTSPSHTEARQLVTFLLQHFRGAAWDDCTRHFWSLAEIEANTHVSGHPFFDENHWKHWYDRNPYKTGWQSSPIQQ